MFYHVECSSRNESLVIAKHWSRKGTVHFFVMKKEPQTNNGIVLCGRMSDISIMEERFPHSSSPRVSLSMSVETIVYAVSRKEFAFMKRNVPKEALVFTKGVFAFCIFEADEKLIGIEVR